MAFFTVYVGLQPEQYRNLTMLEREAIIIAYEQRHKK